MSVEVEINGTEYEVPTTGNTGWGSTLTTYLQAIATALNGVIVGSQALTQMTAVTPALSNSWVQYGAGTLSAGYWKDSLGVVHLQGCIKDGTTGTTVFILPVGYRPSAEVVFATSRGATSADQVDIDAAGVITAYRAGSTIVCLDGITFRAA